MTLDSILEFAVVILPTILAIVGVVFSLKVPDSRHHRKLRVALFAFGLLVSGLTFWQQRRSHESHAQEINAVTISLNSLKAAQQIDAGRREEAETALLIATRGLQTDTRQGISRLAGLNETQMQQLGAQRTQTLEIELLNLRETITTLHTNYDEWLKANNEARSKLGMGTKGRYDPDYGAQMKALREQYSETLTPTYNEAKSVWNRLNRAVPDAHIGDIGDDSRLGRAANGEVLPIEFLHGIIAQLVQTHKKVSDLLLPPQE